MKLLLFIIFYSSICVSSNLENVDVVSTYSIHSARCTSLKETVFIEEEIYKNHPVKDDCRFDTITVCDPNEINIKGELYSGFNTASKIGFYTDTYCVFFTNYKYINEIQKNLVVKFKKTHFLLKKSPSTEPDSDSISVSEISNRSEAPKDGLSMLTHFLESEFCDERKGNDPFLTHYTKMVANFMAKQKNKEHIKIYGGELTRSTSDNLTCKDVYGTLLAFRSNINRAKDHVIVIAAFRKGGLSEFSKKLTAFDFRETPVFTVESDASEESKSKSTSLKITDTYWRKCVAICWHYRFSLSVMALAAGGGMLYASGFYTINTPNVKGPNQPSLETQLKPIAPFLGMPHTNPHDDRINTTTDTSASSDLYTNATASNDTYIQFNNHTRYSDNELHNSHEQTNESVVMITDESLQASPFEPKLQHTSSSPSDQPTPQNTSSIQPIDNERDLEAIRKSDEAYFCNTVIKPWLIFKKEYFIGPSGYLFGDLLYSKYCTIKPNSMTLMSTLNLVNHNSNYELKDNISFMKKDQINEFCHKTNTQLALKTDISDFCERTLVKINMDKIEIDQHIAD